MTDVLLDDAIEALSDGNRRQLLLELRENNPHDEVPTASRGAMPARELDIEMVHNHLPKLDDFGFVEWDRETGTVYRGPRFEEVSRLLETLDDHESELTESEP